MSTTTETVVDKSAGAILDLRAATNLWFLRKKQ